MTLHMCHSIGSQYTSSHDNSHLIEINVILLKQEDLTNIHMFIGIQLIM